MPNGTHHTSVDGAETTKEARVPTPLSSASEATEKQSEPSAEEESQTEPALSPQKKVIKPPMPPTKEAKPCVTPEDKPDTDEGMVKKVCIMLSNSCHIMQEYLCMSFFLFG